MLYESNGAGEVKLGPASVGGNRRKSAYRAYGKRKNGRGVRISKQPASYYNVGGENIAK